MSRRISLALVAGLLLACGAPSTQSPPTNGMSEAAPEAPRTSARPATGERGLNSDVTAFDVDGVPVLLKTVTSNEVVHIGLYLDGGSAGWTGQTAGAEHLALVTMARGGAASTTRGAWNAALDRVGASVSAGSGYDFSSVQLSCIGDALDVVWPGFLAMLEDPGLRDGDIALHREQIVTSLRSEVDNPDAAAARAARELLWDGHTYANRPEGSEEALASFTVDDLRGALARVLTRERARIVIVGPLDEAAARARAADLVARLGSDPAWSGASVPPPPARASSVRFVARPELPTNYILGYFPAPSPDDPEYPTLRLALELYSDRLFEEVRSQRNLTYAVAAGMSARRASTGYLYVTATDPETTLDVMHATLRDLIENPIEEDVLRGTLAVWKTQWLMSQTLNEALASQLVTWELIGGGRLQADAFLSAMEAVTPADIARTLERWVRNVQFAVVGDDRLDPGMFTRW